MRLSLVVGIYQKFFHGNFSIVLVTNIDHRSVHSKHRYTKNKKHCHQKNISFSWTAWADPDYANYGYIFVNTASLYMRYNYFHKFLPIVNIIPWLLATWLPLLPKVCCSKFGITLSTVWCFSPIWTSHNLLVSFLKYLVNDTFHDPSRLHLRFSTKDCFSIEVKELNWKLTICPFATFVVAD